MTVFITLEPYLIDWLKHESGGEYPIHVIRGSAESDILERYLTVQPRRKDYVPQMKAEEGQVEIVIPWFKYKDIRCYNYLPDRAKGSNRLSQIIETLFLSSSEKPMAFSIRKKVVMEGVTTPFSTFEI